MINLFKIKGQKREEAANAAGRTVKKQSPGELRLQKGLNFDKFSGSFVKKKNTKDCFFF